MTRELITSGQLRSVSDLVKAVLRKRGATKAGMDKILARGNEFQDLVWHVYTALSCFHPGLEFVSHFLMDIPEDFTGVDCRSCVSRYSNWDDRVNARNFPRSSLVPGHRYLCEIYHSIHEMSLSKFSLAGKSNGSLLGVALGCAVISSYKYRDNLPDKCWVICLGDEDQLWRYPRSTDLMAPVCRRVAHYVEVGIREQDDKWSHDGIYVPYFRDLGPCV